MMFKLSSKISSITDSQVIDRLIHPDVFAKLHMSSVKAVDGGLDYVDQGGVVQRVKPTVTFDHEIETTEFVFSQGRMTIQRDGLEVLVEVFYLPQTSTDRKDERKALRCAIRDRQLDGTEKTSPLSTFPNTHEGTNTLPHPDFKVAELSIYCYDPERYLPQGEMLSFIMGVDEYIYKHFEPVEFFRLWRKAFEASNMAPWQPAPPIKGVAEHFVNQAGALLTPIGYHRMDAVCGWYNAALFFIERMGFSFTYGEHEAAFHALENALKNLERRVGRRLNNREKAWVVALQNIPACFIPDSLRLGCRWVNSPTYTSYCCRLHKDLNPFPSDARVAALSLPALFVPAPGGGVPGQP